MHVFLVPPPLCQYYTWIDLEQSPATLALMKIEARQVRARWFEMERREKEAEEHKLREEMRRRRKEEEKRLAEEAREEERARKRERAGIAQAEDKEHDRKGKWPRVLDL